MKLAQRILEVAPSPTLAVSARAKQMIREGRPVINLSAGEPDLGTPESIAAAGTRALQEGWTTYTPTDGVPMLKEARCQKLARENGLTYQVDEVIVGAGAKQILYNAIQVLCNEGDEVIIPRPFWVTYPEQAKLAGARPVSIPLEGDDWSRLDPAKLKQAIHPGRTRVLVLNTPQNPTGGMLDADTLKAVADVVLGFDELYVLSDEIYENYIYGRPHVSLASLGDEVKARTVTVNGFSKTFCMTGLRVGYGAGPREIIQAMKRLQGHSTSCPCSVSQRAAMAALELPSAELERIRSRFRERRDCMVAQLNRLPGIRCVAPPGAFYVFVDMSAYLGKTASGGRIESAEDLSQYLLETAEVATVPGSGFGAPTSLRLSYTLSPARIEEAVERLETVLTGLTTGGG